MFREPLHTAGGATPRPAAPAAPSRGTACRGDAADTSPDELSMLADQLTDFRRSARLLRVQCALEQARSFVAGHVITTVLAFALLALVVAILSR